MDMAIITVGIFLIACTLYRYWRAKKLEDGTHQDLYRRHKSLLAYRMKAAEEDCENGNYKYFPVWYFEPAQESQIRQLEIRDIPFDVSFVATRGFASDLLAIYDYPSEVDRERLKEIGINNSWLTQLEAKEILRRFERKEDVHSICKAASSFGQRWRDSLEPIWEGSTSEAEFTYKSGTGERKRKFDLTAILQSRSGEKYIFGYCYYRKEYRTFKVAHIQSQVLVNRKKLSPEDWVKSVIQGSL